SGAVEQRGTGTTTLTGSSSYTGGTTIAAGTLQLGDGGTSGSITGDVANNGTLAFNRSDASTFAGAIGGSGAVEQRGTGTTTLTGSSSYTGGTTIAAGTLQLGDGGTSGSITGNVTNNGTLAFNRSDAVSFAGTISGSGKVEQRGSGSTTLAAANSYTGGTAIEGGTLVGTAASFGSGAIVNNAALVIDQGSAAAFANAMSGSGSFTKAGAGALNLTGDSSAFTGASRIAAGTMAVNGSLGGTLSVASGATLKGNGTVGSTVVEGGALVAPGNSIGTLHVAGDLTLASGAAYQVEASPDGRSDQILATGKATVQGASVITLAADGNWNPYGNYTILKADGGVAGQFGSVSSNFAFLTPTLSYTPTSAMLTLMRNDVAFASVGSTWNQKSSAGAIEPLNRTPLYRAVVQLDAPNARVAFDQLSGELHATVKGAALEDSRLVRDTVLERARQSVGGVGGVGATAANGTQLSETENGSVWGRAYGVRGETRGDGNATNADRTTSGLLIGADRRVGDATRVGVFGGFGHTSLDTEQNRGRASGDAWHLGVYGGTQWGALGLRGGASYSRQSLETQRNIFFTGVTDALSAKYSLRTLQAFAELGWRIDTSADTAFEPFVGVAHADVRGGSFTERGLGSGAALTGYGNSTRGTFATLGLRASTRATLGGLDATLRGSVGWRKLLSGDATPGADVGFYGGQSRFTVLGTPLARDAFVVDAGIDLALRSNLTLGVSYSLQTGGNSTMNGVKADMRWKF
ncbi:MAG TPA: autotransporter domain-containing protein, partial [Burkholderiaceae bacterium]|nr:autotransporter domain-containing protein [Burkholderiaceae bacterium]